MLKNRGMLWSFQMVIFVFSFIFSRFRLVSYFGILLFSFFGATNDVGKIAPCAFSVSLESCPSEMEFMFVAIINVFHNFSGYIWFDDLEMWLKYENNRCHASFSFSVFWVHFYFFLFRTRFRSVI